MFTHDHSRILDDSATTYAAWIDAARGLDALGPALNWKTINGTDYLYERFGAAWGASRGARDERTEAIIAEDLKRREGFEETLRTSNARLGVLASQYRALGLPRVHPIFGQICRAADLKSMLGNSILVVGTNAMPVYEVEAQDRFLQGLNETQDCDFAWAGAHFQVTAQPQAEIRPKPFYALVKSVDEYFTVNQERPFQLRNREGYEVELLLAPSRAASYPKTESVLPSELPEQEWLLMGRKLSHVVFDTSNKPVRIVAPDPRWMALHKLWLADKPTRNPLKRPKDRKQGQLLAAAVAKNMPGFPVSDEFLSTVPEELRRYVGAFSA
ncbi:MAG: hypothetical protein E6Q76_05350 [Rhizobium sp.]|nr:MAG: hypothetical protein E6Q76_05350 [Rhizobium sp.]